MSLQDILQKLPGSLIQFINLEVIYMKSSDMLALYK